MSEMLYWILSNPAFVLFALALLMVWVRLWGRGQIHETALRVDIALAYILLLAVGVNGLYNFVMHAFFGDAIAAFIGWPQSPFQMEVAMANLAFGILGVLCFRANFGFRLATVIGLTAFMWGAAVNHIYDFMVRGNPMPGNIGTVLLMDILIPLTLIMLIWVYHDRSKGHVLNQDKFIDA